MQTTHTPGPWFAMTCEGYPGQFWVSRHVEGEKAPIAHTVANARLIASAPGLLLALQAMLHADDAICNNIGSKSDQAMSRIAAIDAAVAAIARATGAA